MPDAFGNLTADEQNKVREWWSRNWKGSVQCPICKNNKWTTGPQVVQVSRFATDAHLPGVIVYPYIPVECDVCGHVILFDAVRIGVVAATPPMPAIPQPGLGGLSSLLTGAPTLPLPPTWVGPLKKGQGNG